MLRQLSVVLFCSAFTLSLAGCGGSETDTQPPSTDAAQVGETPATDAATIAAEMEKLSEEDRVAAMAQKVCPVGGGALGSMGVPIKVELAGGKSAFVCCAGCADPLKKDPEKYLAKLDPKGADAKTE